MGIGVNEKITPYAPCLYIEMRNADIMRTPYRCVFHGQEALEVLRQLQRQGFEVVAKPKEDNTHEG